MTQLVDIAVARDFCAKLPGATRDLKRAQKDDHGDGAHAVFSVGAKMFAMFTLKHDRLVDESMFEPDAACFIELTDRKGFRPAPRLAEAKRVEVDGVRRLTDTEAERLSTEAHHAVTGKPSKKVQQPIREGDR